MMLLAMMQARMTVNISWVDYLIIAIYFIATPGVGFVLKCLISC
jgi:hypothetical protein